jgi:D-lyxose ketol-isomerase
LLTALQIKQAQKKTLEILSEAKIILAPNEVNNIEIADFGLNDLERTGLQIITYVNNDRYCAKELALFPRQTCPEHKHPPIGSIPGKMETFRCRWGKIWLYVEGAPSENCQAHAPAGTETHYTVFHEIELNPGEQFTISPDTFHWFQAGDEGAIVSEFSSTSRDDLDVFTDPRIKRIPQLFEE